MSCLWEEQLSGGHGVAEVWSPETGDVNSNSHGVLLLMASFTHESASHLLCTTNVDNKTL